MATRQLSLSLVLATLVLTGCRTIHPPGDPTDAPTSAAAGDTTIVAIAPPKGNPPSLWEFLGVPQAAKGIGALVHCGLNQLGMVFPGLEPKPPLLAISDPANLSEDASPAVQEAAKIKAEEDAAAQKIKAIRYLATIGCGGCYPGVEDALLSAMDDCTEAVRYEAVVAIRATTSDPCIYCSEVACCSSKVQEKLNLIGYETDSANCPTEPSERVRRQARLAAMQCGPVFEEVEEPQEQIEGPSAEPVIEGEGPPPLPSPDNARIGTARGRFASWNNKTVPRTIARRPSMSRLPAPANDGGTTYRGQSSPTGFVPYP